jgi:hypothetical protein
VINESEHKGEQELLRQIFVLIPFWLFVFAGIMDIGRVYHQILLANGRVRDEVCQAVVGKDVADIRIAIQTYDKI